MVKVKYYENNGSVTASLSYKGTRERVTRRTKAELVPIVKSRINQLQISEAQLVLGMDDKKEIKKIKISEAIRHHYEQREMSVTHKKGLSSDRHFFKKFYEFMFSRNKDYLHEIVLSDLLDLRSRLKNEEGQAASSVNRFMASINGFLNRAELLGWIEVSPAKKLRKLPESQPVVKVMEHEELKLILDDLKIQWVKDFLEFMDSVICRPREAADANIRDVDLDKNIIILSSAKGGTIRSRRVPFTENVRAMLKRVCAGRGPDEPVFVNLKGNRIDPNRVAELVRESRKRLGIEDGKTPYSIRRKIITEYADQDIGLAKMQRLIGHRRPETTMRYVHLQDESLRNTVTNFESNRKKTD